MDATGNTGSIFYCLRLGRNRKVELVYAGGKSGNLWIMIYKIYRVLTRSSKRPALPRAFFEYICWKFAGSCKYPITVLLCSCLNRPHYVPCLSICLTVCPSVYLVWTSNLKTKKLWKTETGVSISQDSSNWCANFPSKIIGCERKSPENGVHYVA